MVVDGVLDDRDSNLDAFIRIMKNGCRVYDAKFAADGRGVRKDLLTSKRIHYEHSKKVALGTHNRVANDSVPLAAVIEAEPRP